MKFSNTHAWIKKEKGSYLVGITEFAQEQLGDIVYLGFPKVGLEAEVGDSLADIESSKSVSDLDMPFNGKVIDINRVLEDSPELLNSDPLEYWIVKIIANDDNDYDNMLEVEEGIS